MRTGRWRSASSRTRGPPPPRRPAHPPSGSHSLPLPPPLLEEVAASAVRPAEPTGLQSASTSLGRSARRRTPGNHRPPRHSSHRRQPPPAWQFGVLARGADQHRGRRCVGGVPGLGTSNQRRDSTNRQQVAVADLSPGTAGAQPDPDQQHRQRRHSLSTAIGLRAYRGADVPGCRRCRSC